MSDELRPIPIDEPTTIQTAYKELSKTAFSVWIRLMVADEKELIGRDNIEEAIGFSQMQTTRILQELRRKGYVESIRKGNHGKVNLRVRRRALLSGKNSFIRLSNFALDLPLNFDENDEKKLEKFCRDFNPQKMQKNLIFSEGSLACFAAKIADKSHKCSKKNKTKGMTKSLSRFSLNHSVNIKSLREKHKSDKESRRIKHRIRRNERSEFLLKGVNFQKLHQICSKLVSNAPDEKLRKKMIRMFEQKKNNPKRRKFIERISSDFEVAYVGYRQLILDTGRYASEYEVMPKEKKYLAIIAENCIRQGITYAQLLEYWHDNLKNLFDSRTKAPPLSFLSNSASVESAAFALFDEKKKDENQENPFSNTLRLDKRLRPGLNAAGFNTTKLSDRALMSIQLPAQDIADGNKVFVSKNVKPLVDWAAENLYMK